MDWFFKRTEKGKTHITWCNSLAKAREFAQTGWERIEREEFERIESERISGRKVATARR